MSVENVDGPGLSDQPSVIYGFTRDGHDEIRELSRSGWGQPGPSPGEVIERDTTRSSLTDGLPELPIPGQDGLARDDCGETLPAFACEDCGNPVYVGRTCANPTCDRDWAAAVKSNVVRAAGSLEGLRRALYARYDGQKDIDFNHVVASLPSLRVDSDEPLDRALLIIKTLLEEQWDIDGFLAVYHPYRIKQEYREDQYEHGGADGDGDMTWKDVLSEDDPYQYLTHEPHFHLLFPAIRRSFDYSVAEAVQEQSGWLFHRITKGDSNVSVEDLEDLVHQLTYCLSHGGVRPVADRDELVTRQKGDLHEITPPDDAEDQVLAAFCEAAPKLLGVRFSNLNQATCSAEVGSALDNAPDQPADETSTAPSDAAANSTDRDHPLYDVFNPARDEPTTHQDSGDPWESSTFEAGVHTGNREDADWTSGSNPPRDASESRDAPTETEGDANSAGEGEDSGDEDGPAVEDDRRPCGGSLVPMWEARQLLDRSEWCQQAEYVSGLRDAVAEWERVVEDGEDGEARPWASPDEEAGDVVRR